MGFGVGSINATIQRQNFDVPLDTHKFNGNTLEFHIGYNKELKDYGLNGFVTGLELSYNNDFFGEIKDQYSCSYGNYICRSKINYSYQAKIKVGYKYDNFLPNLFIGKSKDQITTNYQSVSSGGFEGGTDFFYGNLFGFGSDYYLNKNSFLGFSFTHTIHEKQWIYGQHETNSVNTKLKYSTIKLTYNYLF